MFYRGRRLSKNAVIRKMMQETVLQPSDFVYPIFVVEGENVKREIPSLKGICHYSVDKLPEVVREMEQAGVYEKEHARILGCVEELIDRVGRQRAGALIQLFTLLSEMSGEGITV